ncbi:hypothetical protein WJX73_001263 [Symbiochloris irregularis]|uniref:Protein kinase domain-containing protein n=1 Tax=Symbiochloris irregularis TaxID=706552 RepID=A0AAW1P091_9CHLO
MDALHPLLIADVAKKIATAAAHMHELGWIHRRIRLDHILVDGNIGTIGEVWLSGLSKAKQVAMGDELLKDNPKKSTVLSYGAARDVRDLGKVMTAMIMLYGNMPAGSSFKQDMIKFRAHKPALAEYMRSSAGKPFHRLLNIARKMVDGDASMPGHTRPSMNRVVEMLDEMLDPLCSTGPPLRQQN